VTQIFGLAPGAEVASDLKVYPPGPPEGGIKENLVINSLFEELQHTGKYRAAACNS